jgi:serine/threonine protein kinase
MASKIHTTQLLSLIETRMAELEQAVQGFEQTTIDAEKLIDEQAEGTQEAASALPEAELASILATCAEALQRVRILNTNLDETLTLAEQATQVTASSAKKPYEPLPEGTLILQEKYRIVQLLHTRPRVHLYLAQRLSDPTITLIQAQPLVSIREIVLDDLTPELCQRIEQATFAEFAAPGNLGSSNLPGVGDRIQRENTRLYLVMQPRRTRGKRPVFATTLTEFLAVRNQNPSQLEVSLALHWGKQLCLTLARLHQMKIALGELTPEMIIVPGIGYADWAPLLLPSWPPAPTFWTSDLEPEVQELYNLIFPSLEQKSSSRENRERAFIAPETLVGYRDERSDVYTLGALLYLLLTRNTPTPASQRLRTQPRRFTAQGQSSPIRPSIKAGLTRLLSIATGTGQNFILTPPHLLNELISPQLEQILLRALALGPEQRFPNILDMVQALEGLKAKTENPTPEPTDTSSAKASQEQPHPSQAEKEP